MRCALRTKTTVDLAPAYRLVLILAVSAKHHGVFHTNDPANLRSGPEFWLQFANAIAFEQNYCGDFFIVQVTVVLTKLQVLR